MLQMEFVKFHGTLVLLQNWSALNYAALVKILKKHGAPCPSPALSLHAPNDMRWSLWFSGVQRSHGIEYCRIQVLRLKGVSLRANRNSKQLFLTTRVEDRESFTVETLGSHAGLSS